MFDKAQVYRYSLPLKCPLPLRGQSVAQREGLLLRLTDESGASGWGDAAPLPGFSRETLEEAQAFLVVAGKFLSGDAETAASPMTFMEGAKACPAASFAMGSAVWSHGAAAQGGRTPDQIPLNALLAGTDEEILARAAELAAQGFGAAKLKVGGRTWQEDAALVRQVRERLGTDIHLRLDANRAWDLETALNFGHEVHACDIEYIEEPVQNPKDLPRFAEETDVPYALDETLQEVERAIGEDDLGSLRPILKGAAANVWKPTLTSLNPLDPTVNPPGPKRPPVVLSACFESGVGIGALAQLAARSSGANVAAGLDTYNWLAEDVLEEPLPIQGGTLNVKAVTKAAQRVDKSKLTLVWES